MDETLLDVPYTDEWWFKQLFLAFHDTKERRNGKRMSRIEWFGLLWSWFEGNPPLPEHAEGWKSQASRDVLRMGRANFAKLSIESKLDRLKVLSFRTSLPDKDAQEKAEAKARKLMKRYASAFHDASVYASVMSEGYIWTGLPGSDGLATVTAEDPRECVTINDPIHKDKTLAALKLYRDDLTKQEFAHVILPARDAVVIDGETVSDEQPVRVMVATRKSIGSKLTKTFSPSAWTWDEGKSGPLPTEFQGRGVPVQRVQAPFAMGDFEGNLDLLNRINNMIVDRLWIAKLQVFRQRAFRDTAKDQNAGDPWPEKDENGKKIDYDRLFEADPGALWRLPQGIDIWESTPTDLTPVLTAVRDDIKEFAAVTRTPLYVFTPDALQGSAEGAATARESQVFKVETWQDYTTRPFLAAAADMLAVSGEVEAAESELDLVWMSAERLTMSQRADGARVAKETGVPTESVWEDFWQASPEQITRWKTGRTKDLFFQPPAPAPSAAPATPAEPPAPAEG